MGYQSQDAEYTTKSFFKEYLVNRDLKAALNWLTEGIYWTGLGGDGYFSGRKQVSDALERECFPDPCELIWKDIREERLTPQCAVMLGNLEAVRTLPNGDISGVKILMTSVCVLTASGYRIASIHVTKSDKAEKSVGEICQGFQTALCGIMQYRLLENGRAVFKSANRESLRILGYEPEEFWARGEWDWRELIEEEDYERAASQIGTLKKAGDSVSFEYRARRRDREYCWIVGRAEMIRDTDGEQIIQSVYLDVDSRKRMEYQNQQLLELAEARSEVLDMALEHTTLCEFYYYPDESFIVIPKRTCAHYNCRPRYEHMPESFAEDMVMSACRHEFCRMFNDIHSGKHTASSRIQTISGLWCRVTMSAVNSRKGQSGMVVGIMEDITKEQTMAMALEEAKSLDGLTGLWNREAGTRLAQEYMARKPQGELCSLMLLDMDHFTRVNREEGAAFADAVLQEVADILRSETEPNDIRVRMGGDEFMLVLKGQGKAGATLTGPRIAARVKELLLQLDKDINISVSIGMCATEVVDEYSGLYRCAESTLKYVKENCQGRAACYLDTSNELGELLTDLYTEKHPLNTIEQKNMEQREDLISFALDLLGKSRNLKDAVQLLFARLGKAYSLDRVSLLDVDIDYLTCRFSYQWARDKSDLMMHRVFYITRDQYESWPGSIDAAHGMGQDLEDDALDMACIQAPIWNQGLFSGVLCFEVRKEGYRWSDEQKRLLEELSRIIPSFVMKARADAVSQAKTDFLSRMSHEIRTPLNAIVGMTSIARNAVGDKEKVLKCLDKLESSNQYLIGLVNDILDMSRIESGKMELNLQSMDMAGFMESLDGMMRPQAEQKGLVFTVDNGCSQGMDVVADPLRLEQVLINIIGNAVKFTDQGGSVAVVITPREEQDRISVTFSVKDTGIGIAPEAMDSIFNAFEQAERNTAHRYGGTGLGLAISSRLVQMMGGTLKVRSEPGRGSEFFFTVAFHRGSAAVMESSHEEPKHRDFTGMRILVVEDNELNREIAQSVLEMRGFQVETAVNGQAALDAFVEHDPGYYDGVLMDIRMPVMDGMEAARRLRTMGRPDSRTVPIIAMTANAFDDDSRKSLESGMNGHLSKPIRVEALMKMLDQCLQ